VLGANKNQLLPKGNRKDSGKQCVSERTLA